LIHRLLGSLQYVSDANMPVYYYLLSVLTRPEERELATSSWGAVIAHWPLFHNQIDTM